MVDVAIERRRLRDGGTERRKSASLGSLTTFYQPLWDRPSALPMRGGGGHLRFGAQWFNSSYICRLGSHVEWLLIDPVPPIEHILQTSYDWLTDLRFRPSHRFLIDSSAGVNWQGLKTVTYAYSNAISANKIREEENNRSPYISITFKYIYMYIYIYYIYILYIYYNMYIYILNYTYIFVLK